MASIYWLPRVIILTCGILAASDLALADPLDAAPSTEQMVQQLKPRSASRGIVIGGAGAIAPAAAPSIDLAVSFEFNSARLTTDAELLLDRLGAALQNPALGSSHFRIAGNTDAAGGSDYNLRLSQSRASAVKAYLVGHHGIAAERLATVGYGSSHLLDPQHPRSAVNRRVEITNTGTGG